MQKYTRGFLGGVVVTAILGLGLAGTNAQAANPVLYLYSKTGMLPPGQMVRSEKPWAPRGPGVPGYSFMAMAEQEIKLADCHKVLLSMAELIQQPIEAAEAFLDFSVLCLPLDTGSLVAFNFVTEPWNKSEVAAFEKLMASLQDKRVGEIVVHFDQIKTLTDGQRVVLTQNGGAEVYAFSRTVPYASMVANYLDIEKENRAFRVPDLYKFVDFLRILLAPADAKLIEDAMTENHTITSWHRPTVTLMNGTTQESNMALGNNRFCEFANTPCQ